MTSHTPSDAVALESVDTKSAPLPQPDRFRPVIYTPDALARACARLPAGTRAVLEQYLSECFLEAVTARIEPDGSLRLDTVSESHKPSAGTASFDQSAEQNAAVRRLKAALQM